MIMDTQYMPMEFGTDLNAKNAIARTAWHQTCRQLGIWLANKAEQKLLNNSSKPRKTLALT